MSKAEERALEVYPRYEKYTTSQRLIVNDMRDGFIQGYEQAEKDLALTPEDIKLITKIHYEIVFKDTTGIKVGDVASEVLKRFKETKG